MKSRRILPLMVPLIACPQTDAEFVGITYMEVPNEFALTYRIYAQFDGGPGDFVFAVSGTPLNPLYLVPDAECPGTFYQHQFGNDLPPNSNLFRFFPSVEYDTFVTIGKLTSEDDATALAPGWPGFGPDGLEFDDTGWFVTPDDPQGNPDANNRVLLMQLSTNFEPFGIITGQILVSGFSGGSDFQAYVFLGPHCDPDPYCDWDIDGDFAVGITDLLILLANWGNPYGIDHLNALIGDWGGC